MEISNDEYRDIMRWLNRKEFLRFCILSDSDAGQEICYFHASFNITKIKIREKLYGLRLLMETDKPFGYGYEQIYSWNFASANTSKMLTDNSDEIGYIYPTLIIKCKQAGNLILYNDLEDCTTVIKNCKVDEIITLHGDTQIITTSLNSHDICNDFNYEFFRIGNTYKKRNNKITASLKCDITLKYSPIIKDTP